MTAPTPTVADLMVNPEIVDIDLDSIHLPPGENCGIFSDDEDVFQKEKKLQKLAKTMDHLERAKREESAPLIEAAYQHGLVEERILHEREQQQEVELSRQRHAADLIEKERLSRMMGYKEIYQERVVSHRQVEFNRLRRERKERISRILPSRKLEREKMRKLKYYLEPEEERKQKLRKEEEARKHQEAEREKRWNMLNIMQNWMSSLKVEAK